MKRYEHKHHLGTDIGAVMLESAGDDFLGYDLLTGSAEQATHFPRAYVVRFYAEYAKKAYDEDWLA